MRKFLAAMLAVLMIMAAVAVLPVSAEDTKSGFDGTDATHAESMPLVITEMMSNTTASVYEEGTPNYSANAFQYIEVYNKGDEPINLYDLALVRGLNKVSSDPWESQKKFLEATGGKGVKMSLNPGNIYEDAYNANGAVAVNQPGTCFVEPGEFAIIWFWNSSTNAACTAYGGSLGAPATVGEETVYHKGFRDHYRTQNSGVEIPNDVPVIAVCSMGQVSASDSTARWSLNTSSNYIYALVWDQAAGQNFDPNTENAFSKVGSGENAVYTYNEDIVCMWQWGTLTNASIPNNGVEGKATIYVPANSMPDRYNRQQMNDKGLTEILERIAKIEAGEKDADGKDYVVTDEERASVSAEELAKVLKTNYVDADLAYGYKEVAIMAFEEAPTIGSMSAYQWAYVDPDRAPDSVTGGVETWAEDAIETYITTALPTPEPDVENKEEYRDVIFKDRDELGNQGGNKKDPVVKQEKGFPMWALIVIIVGGVVLLAAVAVVVILVIKKKNKPVALDDVAAEGEIEIIDETASADEVVEDVESNDNTEE